MSSAPASLPSGRVTFAFIDVVGSTRTFQEHGPVYVDAVTALHATIADHTTRTGGTVVETEGDGAFLAFPDARSAVDALVALQDELENPNPDGLQLRIRAGAHAGEATPVGNHYLALPVYVAARVAATANAGQLLVTDEVVDDLAAISSPHHAAATEIGSYRLKDIAEPVRIWRVTGDDSLPRATPARRTNVQPSRTSFIGREHEMERLRELVAVPGLVTVVGPGGTGKTRLVSEFALHDAEAIPGGAWLVELATFNAPDQIVPALGSALGQSTNSISAVAGELDRRGRCLLVLDNCKHLVDSVSELVDKLLAGCPELTVLCTSREALNLAAEQIWTLPGLPADGAATELFLQRAEQAWRSSQDIALVPQLCGALDGLPLAIELAASQARSGPLAEILAAVTSGSDPLARRGGEERQRSLDAVLDWSLNRLTPELRDSLLTLSVFPGRFTPEMARRVLEPAPRCHSDATRALARGSLVDLDGPDYRLLSTVRAAAQRRLQLDVELHRQALHALVSWTAAYGAERFVVGDVLNVHEDIPDDTFLAFRTGLRHGVDLRVRGLGPAWELQFLLCVIRGMDTATMSLAERAVETVPDDADSAWQLAGAALLLGYYARPIPLDRERLDTMLAIARETDDPRLLARVLEVMAEVADRDEDFRSAADLRLEVLQLCETRAEARYWRNAALIALGVGAERAGDLATAETHMLRAADGAAEAGESAALYVAEHNLAGLALETDRPAQARDHALVSLREAAPGARFRGPTMALLALAYSALGDREAALAAGQLALDENRGHALDDPLWGESVDALVEALPELRVEAKA